MILRDNKILCRPSLVLIDKNCNDLIDEKIKVFHKQKLISAPIDEKIGVMTGYNTISTDENCGGFCSPWTKQIAVVEESDRVVLHEICHALQADMGYFDNFSDMLVSDVLKLEQQCETMARSMFEKIYKTSGDQIFTAYFKKEDILFLKEWWSGYADDDLDLK